LEPYGKTLRVACAGKIAYKMVLQKFRRIAENFIAMCVSRVAI